MVQEITPTRIGNEVGQSLRQGLSQGLETGMQRGMLKQALGDLSNLPQGATAFDLAKSLISATAGIPGAERYVGQLFPLLLNQMQTKPPEGQATAALPETFGEGGEVPSPQGLTPAKKGYLSSAPLTQPQKLQFAESLKSQNIPLDQGLQMAETISRGSEEALQHIQSNLLAQGISQNELPYATQIAQILSNREGIADPNELIKRTKSAVDEFRQLDNVTVPSTGTAIAKLGVGGLIPALLTGGESRSQILNRLNPLIKSLSDKGYEPILQEKLARQGLSPTEVQEQIFMAKHPEDYKRFESSVKRFPPPSKNESKNLDNIEEFLTKNAENGVPLLSIRHKLWKDKGYDWRMVSEAFKSARQKGLKLNQYQEKELAELSNPPRESLVDIFKDWGRPFDYLLKRK